MGSGRAMAKLKKQRAELRLYLRYGSECALAWQATLTGFDVYAGIPKAPGAQPETLRGSFHASGKSHLHVTQGRIILDPLPPLRDTRGAVKLAGWSIEPGELREAPPPDTSYRQTLVLDPVAIVVPSNSWTVYLWAIERGRRDLVESTLEQARGLHRVLGSLHADWTDPELLAIVTTISERMWEMVTKHLASEGKSLLPARTPRAAR